MIKLSHISWNLAGLLLPLIVAAVTVPALLSSLGQERFGLLALVWGIVGYAGSLDLGLGRALTQYVATLPTAQWRLEVRSVLKTTSTLTFFSGFAFGLLLSVAATGNVHQWFNTTTVTAEELQTVVFLVALVLPVQAMSATYRGLCEASQRFKGINIIRILLGVVTFAGPGIALWFSDQLILPVLFLVIARVLALFVFRILALRCLVDAATDAHFDRTLARRLFSFGGWVTVSGILSPVMLQADRFTIGALLSAAAVSAYVIPYEVVVQSLVLVGAVSATVFPAFSRMIASQPELLAGFFKLWLRRIALGMLFVTAALALFLPALLPLWLGEKSTAEMALIGQILCFGVFANALAAMYYALIQAHGRADVTAKFHLLELPLFLISLFLLIHLLGPAGAAMAWSSRMLLDLLLLHRFAGKHYV
ncbi:MAG: flippase [Burkholderiaceae bacterium]|nr:MAG: flippase [Burkholderiaceae bacterium]